MPSTETCHETQVVSVWLSVYMGGGALKITVPFGTPKDLVRHITYNPQKGKSF